MRSRPTTEELEDFADRLQGPLGDALRSAGDLVAQRMEENGLGWDDLSERQIAELFLDAFARAAPEAFAHLGAAHGEQAVQEMRATVTMALAATAPGNATVN